MATSQMHGPTAAAVAVGTAACAVGLSWICSHRAGVAATGGDSEGPTVPAGALFVFGLGFSGARLARSLRARGWQVGGTTRSEAAAAAFRVEGIGALAFDSTDSEGPGLEAVVRALQQATRAYAGQHTAPVLGCARPHACFSARNQRVHAALATHAALTTKLRACACTLASLSRSLRLAPPPSVGLQTSSSPSPQALARPPTLCFAPT